jgi:aminoglycoside 6'-N-acetyltransferase I
MNIVDLRADDTSLIEQAAALLVEGFGEYWPGSWPDQESALEEVQDMLAPDRICRAALGDDNSVLGWIGGLPEYDGNVWELHPLVVRADQRRRGIGRALVADLEARVRERGAYTLRLGTDDVSGMTSLADTDLYTDLWDRIRTIQNYKGHPFSFYLRCGYHIIGVMPDANGPGKPDIYMAKRIR